MNAEFSRMVEDMGQQEKAFARLYRQLAKRFGLSECGLFLLYFLSIAEGDVTQQDLSEKLLFPKQTVHSAIHRLVEDGVLELVLIPKTKNRKKILLTAAGQSLVEKTVAKLQQAESSAIAKMGQHKMAQYVSLQGEYLAVMKQAFEDYDLLEVGYGRH